MQARLEVRRSSLAPILVLFALAVALLLGGSLGYVLKPTTVENTPARVVVVYDESALYATGDSNATLAQACMGPIVHGHNDC